jgi:hypothetical protein
MSDAGTFTSVNQVIKAAPTVSTLLDVTLDTSKMRVMKDTGFWSGTDLGQNSTMAFGTLPKGALPIMTWIQPIASTGVPTVTTNAVTGTIGLLAGDSEAADLDALGTFTTLAATGAPVQQLAATGAPVQQLAPTPDGTVYDGVTKLNESRQVSVKFTGAIEGVADEGIALTVIYTVD